MTHRADQSNLPLWYMPATPTPTNLPPMEPLQPKTTAPASQRTAKKRQTRPGPQARRTSKRETHAKLAQAAQEQPRDSIGRFAEKGNLLTRFFNPTSHAPTRLKPLSPAKRQHPASTPPQARVSKRKHKKPVPERGFLGKIVALFNGDYTRWRMRNLREQARLRAQIDGYYLPPKKRKRRRRKSTTAQTAPARSTRRKRGIVRRILGL